MPSEQAVFVMVVLVETRRIRNANMGECDGPRKSCWKTVCAM